LTAVAMATNETIRLRRTQSKSDSGRL